MKVRISATIANEYAVRSVHEFVAKTGVVDLPADEVKLLLEDAEFQVDPDGPFGRANATREDLPIRNAYTALVRQLRSTLGLAAPVKCR